GRLDSLVRRDLVGAPFEEVLDSTSRDKWHRILQSSGRSGPPCAWELVFVTPESLEVRTFLTVSTGIGSDGRLWLVECGADPTIDQIYGKLSDLNADLIDAQRKLQRERNLLTEALEKAESAIRSRDEVRAVVSHDLRNPA